MSKFWALITTSTSPVVFDLGQHEDVDHAMAFATEFCEKKNEEIRTNIEQLRVQHPDQNIETPDPYEANWVLDADDYRRLIGSTFRPYVIAREKRESVAAEQSVRHGRVEQADSQIEIEG